MNLSRRERDVMALVIEGAGNKEICKKLHVALGTVKTHMKNIREKLEAKNRTHAAVIYVRSQGTS